MRLADADVLLGDGSLGWEERASLGLGDCVHLVEVTDYGPESRTAYVVDVPYEGAYLGELEDGTIVEFGPSEVVDVKRRTHSMGGVFDWLKKTFIPPNFDPQSRTLVPARQEVIPTQEERRGLLAPIKKFFKGFVPRGGASMFDVFSRKPQLPVEAGEQAAAPYIPPVSMFSTFDPDRPGPLTGFSDTAGAIAVPSVPGPLAPVIERVQEIFQPFQESPAPESFDAAKARQQDLFSGMFAAAPPVEAADIFRPFKKSEVISEKEAIRDFPVPKGYGVKDIKILRLPRRTEVFPTPEDVARGIIEFWDPIDDAFRDIQKTRGEPWFQEELVENKIAEIPLESLGNCSGWPDIMTEVAAFLNIPWQALREHAEISDMGSDEEEWEDVSQVYENIVYPAGEIITEGLNMIKPDYLPGYFSVAIDGDHGCMFVIKYVEEATDFDADAYRRHTDPDYDPAEQEAEPLSEEELEDVVRQAKKPKKKSKKRSK